MNQDAENGHLPADPQVGRPTQELRGTKVKGGYGAVHSGARFQIAWLVGSKARAFDSPNVLEAH